MNIKSTRSIETQLTADNKQVIIPPNKLLNVIDKTPRGDPVVLYCKQLIVLTNNDYTTAGADEYEVIKGDGVI